MKFRAVIFDLGGVVLGSPLHAIADFERESGVPAGAVNRVVATTAPGGAWSRLERGELPLAQFYAAFEGDCQQAGFEIDASRMFERMAAAAAPRPEMLAAIGIIRAQGLKAAALTNNWAPEEPREGAGSLSALFDIYVESSVVGLRKPDPRIYEHTCGLLGVDPGQAVFLDDIGSNLKAARRMGMTTIKVETPDAALADLEQVLDLRLRG